MPQLMLYDHAAHCASYCVHQTQACHAILSYTHDGLCAVAGDCTAVLHAVILSRRDCRNAIFDDICLPGYVAMHKWYEAASPGMTKPNLRSGSVHACCMTRPGVGQEACDCYAQKFRAELMTMTKRHTNECPETNMHLVQMVSEMIRDDQMDLTPDYDIVDGGSATDLLSM